MKKTVNSSYKVGALSSALFSSGTPGGLQSFFDKRMMSEDTPTPDIKPAAAAATEAAETKTAPGVDAPDPIPEGALRRIKTKKSRTVPDDASDGEEEDTENGQYSGPSRKFRVMMEDGKKDRTPLDPEREARTVFVGNLPVKLDAKALKRKFKAYGEVEAVRFRGAARPDLKTTKRVAVITKKFHEGRHNIIAYVRFKETGAARKSCELNGTLLDGHTIRVDMASLPTKPSVLPSTSSPVEDAKGNPTNKAAVRHDQSRAVFVGNVGFAANEDQVRRHFSVCGDIVDVRLVRDAATGMGKGFGYVNFASAESVEKALELHGTEVAGRELRVSRAVQRPKALLSTVEKVRAKGPFKNGGQNPVRTKKVVTKVGKKKLRQMTDLAFRGETSSSGSKRGAPSKKNVLGNHRIIRKGRGLSDADRRSKNLARKLTNWKQPSKKP